MPTFTAVARAAYCPRQLYYARRDDDSGPPETARERQELAFSYPALRTADDATLQSKPIDPPPDDYRASLERLAERDDWDALCAPLDTHVSLDGKDCRGRVHKLVETEAGPVPSFVSPGTPPPRGVWEPQRVRGQSRRRRRWRGRVRRRRPTRSSSIRPTPWSERSD